MAFNPSNPSCPRCSSPMVGHSYKGIITWRCTRDMCDGTIKEKAKESEKKPKRS